jgi:hypothetical protein
VLLKEIDRAATGALRRGVLCGCFVLGGQRGGVGRGRPLDHRLAAGRQKTALARMNAVLRSPMFIECMPSITWPPPKTLASSVAREAPCLSIWLINSSIA